LIMFGGNNNFSTNSALNDLWLLNLCYCYQGYCLSDHTNEDSCSNCSEGYYGPTCNNSCQCVNGDCITGVGCQCTSNFMGVNCDQICIDSNCSTFCLCDHNCSEIKNCNNNISITNQSLIFSENITFQGNLTIEGSNINLTSILLTTFSNISISNSNLIFNTSAILSDECIKLSNTTITVDLSQQSSNISKLLLLNSSLGCLSIDSYNINYLNKPKCTQLESEENAYSLYIIFVRQSYSECETIENQNTISWWEIALIIVGSIVGVALIFLVLVFFYSFIKKKNISLQNE